MVSLGVVWGHWWLQCQGKWQYLQHTCASFFLHVLSFKHSFIAENFPEQSLRSSPISKTMYSERVSKVSCFKTNPGVTEYKLLFHKHKGVKYW